MLTPAAKKRRAEAASATLKRPFRSPVVKKRKQQHQQQAETAEVGAAVQADDRQQKQRTKQRRTSLSEQETESGKEPQKEEQDSDLSLSELVDQFERKLDEREKERKERVEQEQEQDQQKQKAPPATPTQKHNEGGSDEDLRTLTRRWRAAGQMAADEVFAVVQARVERAGGVQAWRTMTGGEGGGDQEEETFTMSMMLASLGIDPDLLRYDETEQRWKEEP